MCKFHGGQFWGDVTENILHCLALNSCYEEIPQEQDVEALASDYLQQRAGPEETRKLCGSREVP